MQSIILSERKEGFIESEAKTVDYLYSETGLHQVKLIHQLFVQRPHVLRHEFLVHRQPVL
uniref:Uncharacterized protein n=1 Tax=Anguilla anguilla TaxID=7936 RepID=A0A0E9RS09_ANGAN